MNSVSEIVKPLAQWCAAAVETIGICIIGGLAFYVLIYAVIQLFKNTETEAIYLKIRRRLGRGILLGLEFLVAADIIHTVAVQLTFKTVGVLAVIVLIRTFLSFTLELEITGNWPWQNKR